MDLARPPLRLALWGALAALAAGGLIALAMILPHRNEPQPPPPASKGGLIIEPAGPNLGRIDPARPLRCFVGGRMVGELTLTDCARRNGVATDALDVGLDASGALAASESGREAVTPLPPAPGSETAAAPSSASAAAGGASAAMAECWLHTDNRWRKLPTDAPLQGCVQALFAGRCETPGNAVYGRWGQQTVRLVPGRVEISADNRSFRTLVEQGPGCSIPPLAG